MTTRRIAPLAPLFLLLLAPLAATATQRAWEQDAVLSLAERLVEELGATLTMASSAPLQKTALQQRTRDAAVKQIQRAKEDATKLADRLRGGDGHLATEGWFRVVRDRVKLAYETAGNAMPAVMVEPHLDATDEIIRELALYYDAG